MTMYVTSDKSYKANDKKYDMKSPTY